MGRSICYGCLVCFLSSFLSFVSFWFVFYDETDLVYVIVGFPMMISSSKLDEGSIQILRDYVGELLLANSINQQRGNIGTWNTKGKTYSFQNIKADIHRICVFRSQCMCSARALPTAD